jgi:hypothetical protein
MTALADSLAAQPGRGAHHGPRGAGTGPASVSGCAASSRATQSMGKASPTFPARPSRASREVSPFARAAGYESTTASPTARARCRPVSGRARAP